MYPLLIPTRYGRLKLKKVFKVFLHFLGTFIDSLAQLIDMSQADEVVEVGGRIQKIQVLITHRTHILPQIVPGLVALMGGNPVSDVVGIAVIEPANS